MQIQDHIELLERLDSHPGSQAKVVTTILDNWDPELPAEGVRITRISRRFWALFRNELNTLNIADLQPTTQVKLAKRVESVTFWNMVINFHGELGDRQIAGRKLSVQALRIAQRKIKSQRLKGIVVSLLQNIRQASKEMGQSLLV